MLDFFINILVVIKVYIFIKQNKHIWNSSVWMIWLNLWSFLKTREQSRHWNWWLYCMNTQAFEKQAWYCSVVMKASSAVGRDGWGSSEELGNVALSRSPADHLSLVLTPGGQCRGRLWSTWAPDNELHLTPSV